MADDTQDQLPDDVDALIDMNLKVMYRDLINESLPDRFQDLLAVIKAEDQLKADKEDDK